MSKHRDMAPEDLVRRVLENGGDKNRIALLSEADEDIRAALFVTHSLRLGITRFNLAKV